MRESVSPMTVKLEGVELSRHSGDTRVVDALRDAHITGGIPEAMIFSLLDEMTLDPCSGEYAFFEWSTGSNLAW